MAKKILVIEDESDILTYLMTLLEDHGFHPCTLKAVESMADAICAVQPDLIVLDVMMPLRSGVSIYKELRTCADLDPVPVVILSGFTPGSGSMSVDFRILMTDNTIRSPDGFIDKPVDVDAFISLVRKLTPNNQE